MTINVEVRSWFDRGAIVETILGDASYFIPSVTFRERHDRWLVLSQLDGWARDRGRLTEASHAVLEAIREARKRHDLETAFDIAWVCLLLEEEPESSVRLDAVSVVAELGALLRENQQLLAENHEVRSLVSSVQARLPGIK
jgi:hypothetical protein